MPHTIKLVSICIVNAPRLPPSELNDSVKAGHLLLNTCPHAAATVICSYIHNLVVQQVHTAWMSAFRSINQYQKSKVHDTNVQRVVIYALPCNVLIMAFASKIMYIRIELHEMTGPLLTTWLMPTLLWTGAALMYMHV